MIFKTYTFIKQKRYDESFIIINVNINLLLDK